MKYSIHSEYVYDLTTENHHFAAGIGNMIVHNTDSVFFTFNLEDPKTKEPIRGKRPWNYHRNSARGSTNMYGLVEHP